MRLLCSGGRQRTALIGPINVSTHQRPREVSSVPSSVPYSRGYFMSCELQACHSKQFDSTMWWLLREWLRCHITSITAATRRTGVHCFSADGAANRARTTAGWHLRKQTPFCRTVKHKQPTSVRHLPCPTENDRAGRDHDVSTGMPEPGYQKAPAPAAQRQ